MFWYECLQVVKNVLNVYELQHIRVISYRSTELRILQCRWDRLRLRHAVSDGILAHHLRLRRPLRGLRLLLHLLQGQGERGGRPQLLALLQSVSAVLVGFSDTNLYNLKLVQNCCSNFPIYFLASAASAEYFLGLLVHNWALSTFLGVRSIANLRRRAC